MQVDLNFKKILITGATGTLGKILVKRLIKKYPQIDRLVIFSRDEFKQSKLSRKLLHPALRYMIGDVRDKGRLVEALKDIDIVIHAAAMKYLDICEKNPEETFKTNVAGTNNIIEAAILNKVRKVIFISTDKAVDPISVYGKSKAEAEHQILKAAQSSDCEFVILRLGNIFKARGSVFEVFEDLYKSGHLTVFDRRSTRYLIKEKQLFKSILHVLSFNGNGIITIPKLNAFKVYELARAFCETCIIDEHPLRDGERVHELLFSDEELKVCYEDKKYFYIVGNMDAFNVLHPRSKMVKTSVNQPLSSEKGNFFSLSDLRKMVSSNYLEV
jgi:UDP-N-acetylglucosamine 4,6-dehydratase/5-epimerase